MGGNIRSACHPQSDVWAVGNLLYQILRAATSGESSMAQLTQKLLPEHAFTSKRLPPSSSQRLPGHVLLLLELCLHVQLAPEGVTPEATWQQSPGSVRPSVDMLLPAMALLEDCAPDEVGWAAAVVLLTRDL